MYNSAGRYEADMAEAMAEDPEGTERFLFEQREKALKSYPENVEIRYCCYCGQPMKYDSINYHEGFHIDSCI